MNYQDYIDLGFTRHDMNDSVEEKQTGYGGFSLERVVFSNVSIGVCSGELDKPKMYIKKRDSETNHIIQITPEAVKDLMEGRI